MQDALDEPLKQGLHLFHANMSTCSQRVRLALEEKQLPWQSHHLDLQALQHTEAEYRKIHPRGLVPALICDGDILLDSNDIIVKLEQRFPHRSLRPESLTDGCLKHWLSLATQAQPSIKVVSHERLFKGYRKITDEDLQRLEQTEVDEALVAFLRDFHEQGPAWQARIVTAERSLAGMLGELEATLAQQRWLSGSEYGLADLSWSVNIYRLMQANYPLTPYAHLSEWAERVVERPAFKKAVVDYQP